MALPYATVDQVYQILRKESDKTDKTDQTYGKLDGDNIWTGFNKFDNNTISVDRLYNWKNGRGNNFIGVLSTFDDEELPNEQWKPHLFTGLAATYESDGDGTFYFGFDDDDTSIPVLVYRGSAVIRSYLMDDTATDVQYEYTLPEKSGTFALTSDIKATHHHTITIKEGTKIIFAANRELESATAATTLETLISTFAGTTTAGFGDYILLTVDTAAKLKKQDGTEVDLSTLTITIEDIVK